MEGISIEEILSVESFMGMESIRMLGEMSMKENIWREKDMEREYINMWEETSIQVSYVDYISIYLYIYLPMLFGFCLLMHIHIYMHRLLIIIIILLPNTISSIIPMNRFV